MRHDNLYKTTTVYQVVIKYISGSRGKAKKKNGFTQHIQIKWF